MSTMKVEIDLAELGRVEIDEETGEPLGPPADMRAMVIDNVTDRLFAAVRTEIKAELYGEIRSAVNGEVQRVVREHVAHALQRPIQRTTRWGEAQGEATSLLELVRLELEEFLNGTSTRGVDRFGDDRKPGNLAELVREQVQDYARTALTKDIQAARNEVTRMVKDAMVEHVSANIAKSPRGDGR